MAEVKSTRKCSVDGCERAGRARGWCSTHYMRWRKHGDPLLTENVRHESTACAIHGCASPRKAREWCHMHYRRWRLNGDPLVSNHEVPAAHRVCEVCGDVPDSAGPARKWCSPTCAHIARRGPVHNDCSECGEPVDLSSREGGRLKRKNATRHTACARVNVGHHAKDIARRDGNECHLCGELVDFSIQWPSLLSKSVDHVVPRSMGGSDAIVNLKLSHLTCNLRRKTMPVEEARAMLGGAHGE